MRLTSACAVLFVVVMSLATSSCGGRGSQTAALLGIQPAQALPLADDLLPALPEGKDFNPSKIVAAVTAARDGYETSDYGGAGVTLAAPHAAFDVGAGQLGWAMFEFSGAVADQLDSVEYFASGRGADDPVWMAISNYSAETWEFLGSRNQDHGTFSPPGGAGVYASPAGQTYLMVLGWDSVSFSLDKVQITYANRYSISGRVEDRDGVGVAAVTVTTTLSGPGAVTDADGNFTLPAIPNGSWHLMATKPGWVFFNNPTVVTVDGTTGGVLFVGELNRSHFEPIEDQEPNDTWWEAPNMNPEEPIREYLSASDDRDDYYRFALTTPGLYFFRFEGDSSLMFPNLEVLGKEGYYLAASPWILSGVVYAALPVATTRVVYVHVQCAGGGGHYELTSGTGELHELHGQLKFAAQGLDYVKVKLEGGGDTTYMYSAGIGGFFGSDFMPQTTITVTPDPDQEDFYDFIPSSKDVDLSLGDDNAVNFDSTAPMAVDNYEPNDNPASAYDFGPLPLTNIDPASAGGNIDFWDWYKFQPLAGRDVIVRIACDYTPGYSSQPIVVWLYDSALTQVSTAYQTAEGLELRSPGPCSGDVYYLGIQDTSGRSNIYSMSIESFVGYAVDVGCLLDGAGVDGARVDFSDFDYGWKQTFNTGAGGHTEVPGRFKNGETVYVELFRYGLNADRYTDTITVAGADVLRWFTADPELSADRWEPNNIYGTPVDYPLEIDATISGISDMADKYLFTPATGDPLHIHFATPAMAQYFSASLYEDATDQYLGGYNWRGSTEFLLPTSGVQAYRLELFSTYGETTYHIAVDESPGYMLSGTILDGAMNPVPTAYVYSEDLNHSVLAAAGTYELGPFWPGSFEIQVYAPNHVPLPGSPFTVEFSTADVTQDIILNYSNSDNYEPNDDWTQATPITDGSHLSANVTKTTDEEDWYKFTADAGLVNVNVTFKKWTSPVGIYLFDTDGTTQLAYSALPEIPYQRIDYVLPAPGIYYVEVHGISNDYIVTVN